MKNVDIFQQYHIFKKKHYLFIQIFIHLLFYSKSETKPYVVLDCLKTLKKKITTGYKIVCIIPK